MITNYDIPNYIGVMYHRIELNQDERNANIWQICKHSSNSVNNRNYR